MDMRIFKYIMRSYLYLRYFFHKITRTGTFGLDRADSIFPPINRAKNALKNALFVTMSNNTMNPPVPLLRWCLLSTPFWTKTGP